MICLSSRGIMMASSGAVRERNEQEVAKKENARAPAIDVRREAELTIHSERSESNVRAIDVSDEVDHNDEWQEPPRHLRHRPLLKVACFESLVERHESS